MKIEKSAIMRKLNKLMPCDTFWSTPKKMVKIGIKSVPPPIPSPPKIPDKKPAKT